MDLKDEAYSLLKANRRTIDGQQYTVPSPGRYPHQWLWDSCFHAIVLASLEPEAAKAELRSLLSKQFPDGMIPHIIFRKKRFLHPYDTFSWGTHGTSSITQPPMLAYAAWEIHRKTDDRAFLEEIYPRMLAYYKYLIDKRDPQDHHLIGIINPDESGEDNSPRFDEPLGVAPDISYIRHLYRRYNLVIANRACNFDAEICMSRNFWVKDVPFNAILIKNLEMLGHIASLLGDKEGEHFANEHRELIAAAMRERLFEGGVFWSASDHVYKLLKVSTWAHFAPFFADLYTKEEARAVIKEHFTNTETFRSPFGIRTVSKKEPSYRPDGFWRGPVWIAPHWFMYKGLVSYGFKEEAMFLKDATLSLLTRSGFREYFNPETGEGYGATNFTWGTLVLDMV